MRNGKNVYRFLAISGQSFLSETIIDDLAVIDTFFTLIKLFISFTAQLPRYDMFKVHVRPPSKMAMGSSKKKRQTTASIDLARKKYFISSSPSVHQTTVFLHLSKGALLVVIT